MTSAVPRASAARMRLAGLLLSPLSPPFHSSPRTSVVDQLLEEQVVELKAKEEVRKGHAGDGRSTIALRPVGARASEIEAARGMPAQTIQ